MILEEIKMDEDNPDTLVHEIFMQNFWKGHPLGKPILGTRETVRSFEQNTLVRFFEQRFQSGNMVFSAAGNIEHDSFVELVARHFSSLAPGNSLNDSAAPTVTAAHPSCATKSLSSRSSSASAFPLRPSATNRATPRYCSTPFSAAA